MSTSPAKFVWYELMTSDAPAAEIFYRNVVGWQMQDAGMPDRHYTILSAGNTAIGGLMALPAEAATAGARPGWIGYVGVADVDASAARVQQADGKLHRPAEDIPGVGRFAVVADPQGAAFVLFKGNSDAQPAQPEPGAPGQVGWRELHARDHKSALAFYGAMFGWTADEAVDMGPMGTYQLFAAGDTAIGGMMNKMAEVPVPFWLYYFNVDDIDAAAARVAAQGGQVLNGPHQVPGGSWILNATDPQGAMFALVGPKR